MALSKIWHLERRKTGLTFASARRQPVQKSRLLNIGENCPEDKAKQISRPEA
jgi:hypothetical protein